MTWFLQDYENRKNKIMLKCNKLKITKILESQTWS